MLSPFSKLLPILLGLLGLITMVSSHPTSLNITEFIENRELDSRSKSELNCCWTNRRGWNVGEAENAFIAAEILKGQGVVGINGHGCGQIACHLDTEIVLCNDNDHYIEPRGDYLATYAEEIMNQCHLYQWFGDRGIWYSCGQYFDTDRYNVIVRRVENANGWCP